MDIATLIGLVLGVAAIIGTVLLEGGSLESYVVPPAYVIILGGTFAATLVNYPLSVVLSLPRLFMKAIFPTTYDKHQIVETIVNMVERARRDGLLSLEPLADQLTDPFMKRGVMMIVDGIQPDLVRTVMENEIMALEERHKKGYAMLESMGGYSPTMGIMGAVMGLITALGHLDDPSELGHSIAVAFVATLLGVALANLWWLPLGGKLKFRSKEEVAVRELVLDGLSALQAGQNPRLVRQQLEAFLHPNSRKTSGAAAAAQPEPNVGAEQRPAEAVS